jgi:RNA polymerase sigma-70 factor (ECF subfamily)
MIRRRQTARFSDLELQADEDGASPLAIIPDPGPSIEAIAEHHDMQDRLQSAIQALPPKFRSVVILRYREQLSFTEIGVAT